MSPEEIDAVRARVRAVMAERKVTGSDVARQAGVAYGTWSSWFGGTYKGRNHDVAERTLHWLNGLEAQDRTRALAPRAPAFVPTPTAEAVLATLEHAQYMPEMCVVTGAPAVDIDHPLWPRLRDRMVGADFRRWIEPLALVSHQEGEAALLQAPSRFHRDWVRQHYAVPLKAALRVRILDIDVAEDIRP